MSFGSFFRGIGRGIARGAKAVGSFVRKGAEKIGDFASKIDFAKIGDIASKVKDVAGSIAGMGIPGLSTVAGFVGRGADVVQRISDKAGKIKEGIEVARQVGGALEKPSLEGVIGAGRKAYQFGKSF